MILAYIELSPDKPFASFYLFLGYFKSTSDFTSLPYSQIAWEYLKSFILF